MISSNSGVWKGSAQLAGRDHVGDRDGLAAGVDPANVLVDDLAARDGDARGFGDESRHAFTVAAGQRRGASGPCAVQLIRSITSGSRSGREPSGAMKHEPTSASIARANRSGVSVCSVISGSPVRRTAPGLACISIPAPAWTMSSLRARPAPSRHAAMPTFSASSCVRTPEPVARIWWVSLATGRVATGRRPGRRSCGAIRPWLVRP